MGERKRFSPPAVGAGALLVIFAVLCLTMFAMLSLSTVQADQRLSDRNAAAVQDYYASDAAAEEILAQLRGGTVPAGVAAEGDTYSYTCPISDTQELQVSVRLSGKTYTILKWQTVSTADWTADDSLHVWNGE